MQYKSFTLFRKAGTYETLIVIKRSKYCLFKNASYNGWIWVFLTERDSLRLLITNAQFLKNEFLKTKGSHAILIYKISFRLLLVLQQCMIVVLIFIEFWKLYQLLFFIMSLITKDEMSFRLSSSSSFFLYNLKNTIPCLF